ncbi:MAG TPA: vWA domain-containing protein [Burkholderiaceae bacterium]|nr:vWA domain-containing protein [Burkholderiaceae bacterium]
MTVNDAFGAPVADANIQGPQGNALTDSKGHGILLVDTDSSTVDLEISRESFVKKQVTAKTDAGNELNVTLERTTSPAGGSMASRSGTPPSNTADGKSLTFEVELAVVDAQAQPILNLAESDFLLQPCSPDPNNGRPDCVSGSGSESDGDVAYQAVAGGMPQDVRFLPGEAVTPQATALLVDQSGSIAKSDPTAARLYSAKAFLTTLGPTDYALLAAFASGPGASIPTSPLTVYDPFKDQASSSSYFATLDSLAAQVGGGTPLYDSIDQLRSQWVVNAPLPSQVEKSIVIFTDGADTNCASAADCAAKRQATIQAANESHVRLFTVGLSSDIDRIGLSELATGTGGAFLFADSVEQLLPLYNAIGPLANRSLPLYRLRWTVQSDVAGAFHSGLTLIGHVSVKAGSGTINVPFTVRIP